MVARDDDAQRTRGNRVPVRRETLTTTRGLPPPPHPPMLRAMRTRLHRRPLAAAFLFATACGGSVDIDPNNRELAWTYGPVTGTSMPEHARGTGSEGGEAVAKGWKVRLQDGKRLVVTPYQLAGSHPLFGDVRLAVGLFAQNGEQLTMLDSEVLTAETKALTFEVDAALGKRLWDVALWYRKA